MVAMMETKIRKMMVSDLAQVCAIEQASFPDPWSEQTFYQELVHNPCAYYWVLASNERILGYIGTWFVVDEGQITNIAVHAHERGQGWGERLLRHSLHELKKLGAETVTLEVRVSNHRAQSLYQKVGFETVGMRPRFYKVCPEDAMIMWVSLNEETSHTRDRNELR
mgnify:CR=1 FL=1